MFDSKLSSHSSSARIVSYNHDSKKIALSEDLITKGNEATKFIFVNTDPNQAFVVHKLAKELEAWQHHAQPFVMAGEFFAVHDLAKPIPESSAS